eukprot:8189428-Karenia_brevis.AAC.1
MLPVPASSRQFQQVPATSRGNWKSPRLISGSSFGPNLCEIGPTCLKMPQDASSLVTHASIQA